MKRTPRNGCDACPNPTACALVKRCLTPGETLEGSSVWSLNGDDFHFTDRDEALDCADAGAPIYVGTVSLVRFDAERMAERLMERAQDDAFDQCGEYAEEIPTSPTPEAVHDMQVWLDRHLHSRIKVFAVTNIRQDGVAPGTAEIDDGE